jgi:hypothetical protein
MQINRFIKEICENNIQECVTRVEAAEYTVDFFREGDPHRITKSILDENIYAWNPKFIEKVISSLSTTVIASFSKKEKDLFDRYRNFLIYEVTDTVDEDVIKLDEYLGTLGVAQ